MKIPLELQQKAGTPRGVEENSEGSPLSLLFSYSCLTSQGIDFAACEGVRLPSDCPQTVIHLEALSF